jgi:hypothetical protein
VAKFEGERLLGRPMHRWEDNIKMYFEAVSVSLMTMFHGIFYLVG